MLSELKLGLQFFIDMITQLLVFFEVIISFLNLSATKFDKVQKSICGEHAAETTMDKLENELNEMLQKKVSLILFLLFRMKMEL